MTDQDLAQYGLSYTTNYIFADLLSQWITDQKFSTEDVFEDLFRNNEEFLPTDENKVKIENGIRKIEDETLNKYKTKTFSKEEIELLMELLDQKDKNAQLLARIEDYFDPEIHSPDFVEPYQRAEMIVEYFFEQIRKDTFPTTEDIVSIKQEISQTRQEVLDFYHDELPD